MRRAICGSKFCPLPLRAFASAASRRQRCRKSPSEPASAWAIFYNYFDGKDAIIDEFAQREVARLAREIDEIVNGRVSLEEQRRQFRESLRKQLAVQRARVKIEIIEEAARNGSMGDIVKRSDAQVRELIKKMHRSRASADVSDEEIEVMVEMDMALVDGMAFRLIAHPELDVDRMISAIVKTVIR